jgi:hypothetical protein
MRYFKILAALTGFLFIAGCTNKQKTALTSDAEVLQNNMNQLTQVIIYDVFTPPVASRIYGYTSLASYEAMRYADPKYSSEALESRLNLKKESSIILLWLPPQHFLPLRIRSPFL